MTKIDEKIVDMDEGDPKVTIVRNGEKGVTTLELSNCHHSREVLIHLLDGLRAILPRCQSLSREDFLEVCGLLFDNPIPPENCVEIDVSRKGVEA